MSVLRLRQSNGRVAVEHKANGVRRTGEQPFTFQPTERDQEDLRWYLEDYLQYPLDPAPKIAERVETRMDEIGVELYRQILEPSPVWAEARGRLAETRVEIVTPVQEATAIRGS